MGAIAAVAGPLWGNFRSDDEGRWIGFLVGSIGALVALSLPVVEKVGLRRKLRAAEDAVETAKVTGRAEFQFAVNFLLAPLLSQLGRVARTRPGSSDRAAAAAVLKSKALDTLMRVTNPSAIGLRATYFKRVEDVLGLRLISDETTGADTREVFDESTVEGRRAIAVVENKGTDFSYNIEDEPEDRIDRDQPHGYATFAAAVAFDGVEKDGLLTVDGQTSGDIASVDQHVVRTVGSIIAISEALLGNRRS